MRLVFLKPTNLQKIGGFFNGGKVNTTKKGDQKTIKLETKTRGGRTREVKIETNGTLGEIINIKKPNGNDEKQKKKTAHFNKHKPKKENSMNNHQEISNSFNSVLTLGVLTDLQYNPEVLVLNRGIKTRIKFIKCDKCNNVHREDKSCNAV